MGGFTVAVNYTEEQVGIMVARYTAEPTRETVENLAEELNKSIKSIIGKLSREGVYKKTEYVTKTGEKPVTKAQLVMNIAELLSPCGVDELSGLEKSPKTALKALQTHLEAKNG